MLLMGVAVGYRIRPRINAEQFRVLVFVLLIGSAMSALIAAFFA
jgi:hypothetical protein